MTACGICRRDPAVGGSSITDDAGVPHVFCHPVVGFVARRDLSCFEIMCYTLVENNPNGLRAPLPIPDDVQDRARQVRALMTTRQASE